MLERLVVTLTVSSLSVTVGGTYAWSQGVFDGSSTDLGPVAQESAPRLPGGATGFGAATPWVDPSPSPSPSTAPARVPGASPAPWEPVAPTVAPFVVPQLVGSVPAAAVPGSVPAQVEAPAAESDPQSDPQPDSSGATSDDDLPPAQGGSTFRVATLNVLGSSHTRAGGKNPGFASGTTRIAGAVRLLTSRGVSVAGLQELQADQARLFTQLTPGWETYPGTLPLKRSGPESLTWDTSVWRAVEKHLAEIPFMDGQERQMPYVLLEHRVSGKRVWFSNVHFAPGNRGTGPRWRTAATDRQVALVNRLAATGHEQVVTGDMNEKERYFCRITGETPLRATAGGSTAGGRCTPPKGSRIDWILVSPGLRYSGFARVRDTAVKAVTDHPLVVTDVALPQG